jgi:hypothetical protein
LTGSKVGDDNRASIVQAKIGGSSTAREPSHGAVHNPVLLDQLLGDERYGAPLQSRNPSQVGARDRLTSSNEIQKHAAVDIPRDLA